MFFPSSSREVGAARHLQPLRGTRAELAQEGDDLGGAGLLGLAGHRDADPESGAEDIGECGDRDGGQCEPDEDRPAVDGPGADGVRPAEGDVEAAREQRGDPDPLGGPA